MSVELVETDNESLEKLEDDEIIRLIHCGNSQALDFLINKYINFVRAKARTYFIIGADKEDIIQEGMIGLYKAIRDYDGDKLSSFKAFAELCVTRQIITAIKTATRQKHTPLNSYVSLDKPIYDEESDRTLLDVIGGTKAIDPQELLVNRENFFDMEGKLSELLSTLEKEVLRLYLDGCTYQEISVKLKRHVKSIDNALQRIKRNWSSCWRQMGQAPGRYVDTCKRSCYIGKGKNPPMGWDINETKVALACAICSNRNYATSKMHQSVNGWKCRNTAKYAASTRYTAKQNNGAFLVGF